MTFLLFGVFPYVAVALAVSVGLYRYFDDRFSFSSFSSQFLENKKLFWGSVPWHYGVIVILIAHSIPVLFPSFWIQMVGNTTRLYIIEITGYALAVFTLGGIALLIYRRFADSRLRFITTTMDWILLVALLVQVISGLYIGVTYRFGAVWYVHTAVPWLYSLFSFNPQVQYVAPLPFMVQLHIGNAFVLVALYPFTRLVHMFSFPLRYLWRPYEIVVWNKK